MRNYKSSKFVIILVTILVMFTFINIAFIQKDDLFVKADPAITSWWSNTDLGLMPCCETTVFDINGDWIKEIFLVGAKLIDTLPSTNYYRAVCVNGSTGELIW